MIDLLAGLSPHLAIAPVVLPLISGAVMLLLGEARRPVKAALSVASCVGLVVVSIILLERAADAPRAAVQIYALGDWPVPFGIVLVADRIASLMVLLTSVLACSALVFSLARWHRAGAHFHSLFQFLLMGLNGAFLTGDLFNLFVFFELLLAASYGLVLHGLSVARVRAGLHYVAVNLAASLLFLIGVSLIYGISGTLNMADLAQRIPEVAPENRGLLEAGASILGVAFLVKAGIWPLCFWLVPAYTAASSPVAAVFAIMTKLGVYILIRLSLLLFGDGAGASAGFGQDWLLYGGMATVVFGAIGTLGSQDLARLAAFSVLVSSGTVLAAAGMNEVGVTGGALFYLVSSTLGLSAFFLLVELVERGREPAADILAVTREAYGEEEEEQKEIGIAIPATITILGLAFICCASVIAGLPPLSGFLGKFVLLSAALDPTGISSGAIPNESWALLVLLILSGLAALVAMVRAGIRVFWATEDRTIPRVRLIEIAPIAVLIALSAAQTVQAGPVMRFMRATAQSLHAEQNYTAEILPPAPP